MQLSYNIIKNNKVNSNFVYTVTTPLIEFKQSKEDTENKTEDCAETVDLEKINKQADEILHKAEVKSKQIIELANAKAQKIKESAYNTAFEKGHTEGLEKGWQDGFNKTLEIRKNAEYVLKDAHREAADNIKKQKNEILGLALTIAEKIIRYEVDTKDTAVINIVKSAIENTVAKGQIVIRVNPMDYAALDCERANLSKYAGENVAVNIVKDNDVGCGGCMINTKNGMVDARIDRQLDRIKHILLG